jgi:hypothetical protein
MSSIGLHASNDLKSIAERAYGNALIIRGKQDTDSPELDCLDKIVSDCDRIADLINHQWKTSSFEEELNQIQKLKNSYANKSLPSSCAHRFTWAMQKLELVIVRMLEEKYLSPIPLNLDFTYDENRGGLLNYAPRFLNINGVVANAGQLSVKDILLKVVLVKNEKIVDTVSAYGNGEIYPGQQTSFTKMLFSHQDFDKINVQVIGFHLLEPISDQWRKVEYRNEVGRYKFS